VTKKTIKIKGAGVYMTHKQQELLSQIIKLAAELAAESGLDEKGEEEPIEMLTLKECMATFKGLTENTVRKLAVDGKIPSIRAGEGRNGKILISKQVLTEYLQNA